MIELSVIIPTRNRADCLAKALRSILSQSLPASLFEVIVVDNGSSDWTAQCVEEVAKQSAAEIRYVLEDSPGLHNGRHRGANLARGSILVYADDDIEAFPSWLEAIARAFQNKDVAMVGGKCLPLFHVEPPPWVNELWDQTPWGKALGYYSLLDFGDQNKEIPHDFIWGCNFSIRKDILDKVGGFHPDAMPSDLVKFRGDGETAVSIAVKAMGFKALYDPSASVYHHVPADRITYEYLYRRAYLQGISDSYTVIRRCCNLPVAVAIMGFRRIRQVVRAAFERWSPEASEAHRRIRRGYWDGVAFHLREVKADPQLLEWVLKKDYRRQS